MSKRILITSTDLMMVQFLLPHVKNLALKGYVIDLACSEVGERFDEMKNVVEPYTRNVFKVDLKRSPLALSNYRGYRQLKKIVNQGTYNFIWTNEPVMGVATRLAAGDARKNKTTVVYMVHGFHFFNGGPMVNWLLFYPIERLMAQYTDLICTVNTDDYRCAKEFNACSVEYIHGIGINTNRLSLNSERKSIRNELGLAADDFIVLSIGELNKNKNQAVIIKALGLLKNPKIHYIICGKGHNEFALKSLVEKLGLQQNVHFLGYRKDVVDICAESNVYVMPSIREGLGVATLEAMYCGLPLITSKIRGLTDINKENVNGLLCRPSDYRKFAEYIKYFFENPEICSRIGARNKKDVIPYTISKTLLEVEKLFER